MRYIPVALLYVIVVSPVFYTSVYICPESITQAGVEMSYLWQSSIHPNSTLAAGKSRHVRGVNTGKLFTSWDRRESFLSEIERQV